MNSDVDTPKLKIQGSKHDSTLSFIKNFDESQQNLQILNDRKVLLIYASGAAAAEGEVNESHMTIIKGRLEQRLKSISYLCDLEYKQQYIQLSIHLGIMIINYINNYNNSNSIQKYSELLTILIIPQLRWMPYNTNI